MSWTSGLIFAILAIGAAIVYGYIKTKTAGSNAVADAEREAREKLQKAAQEADARKKAQDAEKSKWARTDGRTAGEWLRDSWGGR